ncbi:MAG: S-layer homology domain-containing protein [Clostridia bacterium]|nr:S-layer homology domain-containing protein [Clostridia bacterium]
MKRFLAFLMASLMVMSLIPFSISAASDAKIYGPGTLMSTVELSFTGMVSRLSSDADGEFVHATVAPGTYNNNRLQAEFTTEAFSITEYNYIKFMYRTDSPSKRLDVSTRCSIGESWMSSTPVCYGDGQWHELLINTKDITGGKGVAPAGELGVRFILKPFDSQTITLDKEHYFDIKYIACFKSESEANDYKFKASDDKLTEELKNVEVFYKEADRATIDGYMTKMDAMIEEIKNSPTTVTVSGKKYYVSATGDDNNDGLSPEKPWKTIKKVNETKFNDGDGVFFKRGDVWYINYEQLNAQSGVTYSAYGEGAKPKFVGSKNASGKENWVPTVYDNVYVYAKNIPYSVNNGSINDVGAIIFDGGRAWGIQIQKTREGNRLDIGRVFNGIKWNEAVTGPFAGCQDLKNDLEFYHDWDANRLYLYSEGGNPGERFSSIEFLDKNYGIRLINREGTEYADNIVIDNIEIYGVGAHGIAGGNLRDVTVQYCTLTWIGGTVQARYFGGSNYGVRFGNAVQAYGSAEGFFIHDNYASQIYDCCWTAQFGQATTFENIKVYNNVSEYCNSGLEFWQEGGGLVKDVDLHDNYTRYNGYGWSHQRPNKDGNFFYGGPAQSATYENNHVRNNVNIFASANALHVGATGVNQYNFHDNVYIMENDLYLGGVSANPGQGTGGMKERTVPYTETNIRRAVASGFENGGKFYYTAPDFYHADMFDTYVPENGVSVFTDIADNFWGRAAIDYVAIRGYFNGVSANEFSPNGTMTRAMLVTVLSRIAGESANGADATYTDINKNSWYASGVAWAEKAGIVNAGGRFRPDEKATREELADMLYRYALYMNRKLDLSSAKDFKDMASATDAYKDGIKFCTVNGIIGGYEDGTIKPKNSATRAEVATMIQRFKNYLEKAPIDTSKALANAEMTVIKGETLKKMLDPTAVRATVEADGTVKFVPFLEKGSPRIRILDMLNNDISFVKYPYIVVKFKGELTTGGVVATLDEINKANGAITLTGIVSYAKLDSGAFMLDISSYIDSLEGEYDDNLSVSIFPWGQTPVELKNTEYFMIEELALISDEMAAQAYAVIK